MLITHKNCADGTGCALAYIEFNKANGNPVSNLEIVRVQYGDPIPNVVGKDVIIADFSYDKETLKKNVQ